jgi:hypothetical protein
MNWNCPRETLELVREEVRHSLILQRNLFQFLDAITDTSLLDDRRALSFNRRPARTGIQRRQAVSSASGHGDAGGGE